MLIEPSPAGSQASRAHERQMQMQMLAPVHECTERYCRLPPRRSSRCGSRHAAAAQHARCLNHSTGARQSWTGAHRRPHRSISAAATCDCSCGLVATFRACTRDRSNLRRHGMKPAQPTCQRRECKQKSDSPQRVDVHGMPATASGCTRQRSGGERVHQRSDPPSALVDEDAQLFSVVHILHVRRIERDVEPKAFPDNTVPAWPKLLIQRFLDRLRSFLQGDQSQKATRKWRARRREAFDEVTWATTASGTHLVVLRGEKLVHRRRYNLQGFH